MMKICGLQKMTLLDYPGRVACTIFTGGCDFRCPFCHNFELVDGSAPAVMEPEEILSFLKKRKGLLDGVAITGGEPLIHADLPDLVRRIRDLGYPVKLDTNGNHPEALERMVSEGLLDYVAMDVKNAPDRYAGTAGLAQMDLGAVRESVRFLLSGEGPADYEFRTTTVAQLHDEDSFREIGAWIAGAKRYFLQPFTDRDTVPYAGFSAPSDEEMHRYLEIVKPLVPTAQLRGVE